MRIWRWVYVGTLLVTLVVGLGVANPLRDMDVKDSRVPQYVVDPFWPKPLPNDPETGKPWVTGEVAGSCVDSRDHIFTVNRGYNNGLVAPETVVAVPSPPVVEYDPHGNVVNAWGEPAILPNGVHGCFVDYQDNVWIAGNGDGIVQKYSRKGELLLQIGTKGVCDWPANNNACGNSGADPNANQSRTLLNQPSDVAVDPANGDIYIADGYGNHRVVVFDKNGTYLRQWGSVGDGPGQFGAADGGHPHCVVLGNDGLVYTCDRGQDRLEVFDKSGNLVKIIPVIPGTGTPGLGTAGSAWDVEFSPDRRQELMFNADGGNEVVWTFNRLAALAGAALTATPGQGILAGFGRPGHNAGEFTFLHTVAADSKGNLYIAETVGGRRIQKFVPRRGKGNDLHVFTPAGNPDQLLPHYDPVK
ncbi:MAG TPA: 6-bladed beta-propeller [Candidatus Binatia bacterium]